MVRPCCLRSISRPGQHWRSVQVFCSSFPPTRMSLQGVPAPFAGSPPWIKTLFNGSLLLPEPEAASSSDTKSETDIFSCFGDFAEVFTWALRGLRLCGATLSPTTSFNATRLSLTLLEDGNMITIKNVTYTKPLDLKKKKLYWSFSLFTQFKISRIIPDRSGLINHSEARGFDTMRMRNWVSKPAHA